MDPKDIVSRYDKLRQNKKRFMTAWDDAQKFASPYSPPIYGVNLDKGDVDRQNHDSTPALAARNLGNIVTQTTTPADQKWINLRNSDEEVSQEILNYIDEVEYKVIDAINESNFYLRKHEFDKSGVNFGNGIMFIEEGRGRRDLNFKTIPINDVVFAEDSEGYIDTVYREFSVTARELVQKFGIDSFSNSFKEKYNKNPFEEIKILHCVYPRMDDEREMTDKGNFKKDTLNMPYAEYWIEYATKHMIKQSGYRTFPYIIFRWEKEAGEVYGHGPVMDALPDIKQLHRFQKSKVELAEKVTNPPKIIIGAEKGEIDYTPGATNHLDEEVDIHDLVTGANYPITDAAIKDFVERISYALYIQQFQAIGNRIDKEMTAEEVRGLQLEALKILAPVLGRNQNEILEPLVIRILDILDANGKLPPPPEDMELKLEYVNDLTRAMKMSEVNAVKSVVYYTSQLAERFPEIMDNIDADAAYELLKDAMGIPAKISRSKANKEAIRKQRAEQQAQMQNIQLAQAQSEIENTQANTDERSARADEKRVKAYGG